MEVFEKIVFELISVTSSEITLDPVRPQSPSHQPPIQLWLALSVLDAESHFTCTCIVGGGQVIGLLSSSCSICTESGILMVEGTFFDDSFKQDRSWDDSGTTISTVYGTHRNSTRVRMPVSIVVPRVNSELGPC